MNRHETPPTNLAAPAGLTRRTVLKGAVAGGVAAVVGDVGRPTEVEGADLSTPHKGATREYWVQADSFETNLVPSGHDEIGGYVWSPEDTKYWAVGYRAYTPNWGRPLPGGPDIGENSGIPGPVIRGDVGDTIVIHFRNNDTHYGFPHSVHAHGLLYTPENDGAWLSYKGAAPGTAISTGQSYTYRYTVLPTSVGSWVYHDHSIPQTLGGDAPVMDIGTELGLFGLIAIDDPAAAPVDREFILYFHHLYAADVPILAQDFACFNGCAFSPNTPTFRAKVGERVRWRIGALGQEFYVFHLHGHRWRSNGENADTAILGPATTATIEYVEDNPGSWFYHCTVPDHVVAGMVGQYIVTT
jgi:FtsP/CotA-like multicopper oxidase with cupredoxin domain